MRPLLADLGRDFRGGQHQALLLLKGLLSRGNTPQLIALRDSVLARRAADAGIPVHSVSPRLRRLSAARKILRLVREKQIDLVHANEPHALTASWLARAHRAIPVLAARRVVFPLSSSPLSLSRYRSAAVIIAVSKFAAQSVVASGIPSGRVAVIYDGVEIPEKSSGEEREKTRGDFGIPEEAVCISYVAAYTSEKGHGLLLNAVAELRNELRKAPPGRQPRDRTGPRRDCSLLLRGEGPAVPVIRRLAGRLQMEDRVQFVPPSTNIERVFAATDIFAFPSQGDALGTALLAAMAHGLPCVAIARGGVPEVIESGKTGLLVDSLDPRAFADALFRLVKNPEEAVRLGQSARESVAARFSADRMVDETLRLYERTVTRDL
ncbi:MAG: glycosyltransferase family 4 protein [Candidatus Acidiferrales bacterium]